MAVFTLTMVRHGETDANKERIIQGQMDTPLSMTGIRQAELVANRLQHERFTHIYASDLQRALETCQMILDRNLVTKCPLKKDIKLRERKFGQYEGHPISEFINAAKKVSRSLPEFRPPGVEDLVQVRTRAIMFFQDLYQQLQQVALSAREMPDPATAINKKRRHTGSCCSVGSSSEVFQADITPGDESVEGLLLSHEEGSKTEKGRIFSDSTSGYSSCSNDPADQQMSPVMFSPDLSSPSHASPSGGGGNNNGNLDTYIDSPPSMVSLSAYELTGAANVGMNSSWAWPYGCPNVSLSPLIEHRVSSISSISSGRNNSFDDFDSVPALIAEVLVVSHGGLLKELIRHFVEDLGCIIPGGQGQIMRVSPNTGLSKFTISLLEEDGRPRVTCLLLHDKDHLVGSGLEPLNVSIYSHGEEPTSQ